jgi:hypothetical protein
MVRRVIQRWSLFLKILDDFLIYWYWFDDGEWDYIVLSDVVLQEQIYIPARCGQVVLIQHAVYPWYICLERCDADGRYWWVVYYLFGEMLCCVLEVGTALQPTAEPIYIDWD